MSGLNIAKPRKAARRGERLLKRSSKTMDGGMVSRRPRSYRGNF